MSDVCDVLQRIEIIRRISDMVRRYLVELGKQGIIVSMRLKELIKNLNKEREMILGDYFKSKAPKVDTILNNFNFDFLLETSNLSRILFEELHDRAVFSKGGRILNKTNLLEKDVRLLMNNFESIDKIFGANKDDLLKILKNESLVSSLIHDLDNLREKIMAGKRI